jgi:hypothetical protein
LQKYTLHLFNVTTKVSNLACAAEAAAAAAPFSGILAEWAFSAAWMANFFFSRSASHSLCAFSRSSS